MRRQRRGEDLRERADGKDRIPLDGLAGRRLVAGKEGWHGRISGVVEGHGNADVRPLAALLHLGEQNAAVRIYETAYSSGGV